jgi:hypothetical protein
VAQSSYPQLETQTLLMLLKVQDLPSVIETGTNDSPNGGVHAGRIATAG